MTATMWALDLLWSLLGAMVFWAVLSSAFGFRKNPIASVLIVGVLIFGLNVIFDITAGLLHISQVAWIAVLNEQFNTFTVGAIFAACAVLAMVISALAALIWGAVE